MVRKEVFIQNRKGLHARASAQVVTLAESFEATTTIHFQGMCVSTQSIMDLLMLGAGQGSHLVIEGEGTDADQAVSALVELINNHFGEG
jgi:phosphotransferase system HPr (HPr) family protein